ncbi:hypothetical protein KY290_000805 [Solanum tuberosum]|uniref:Uncharacterized protein n=1 Tax=Solanum tuberosum TaxID=4113 RepID=A0ABQ7WKC1_SOLTU|nr:hypothetical protein KY289_000877 [Solanum tuberosum]KAH0781207.1 hypothetical protein KY290_000805 [Solanum tuberosum]
MGGKRPKHDDLGEFQPENDGVDSSPFEGSIENDRKLGWSDIATKITNFINVKTTRTVKLVHRTTEEGLLYAEAVKNNKWSTREMNVAGVNKKGNSLFISEDTRKTQNELLDRSVVGSLTEEISNIHLAEIRRRVQIWIEAPARLVNSGQRGKKGITQQSMKTPYFIEGRGVFECTKVIGHVGTSKSQENLNFTDGQTYQRSRERDEGLDTRVIARAGSLNERRKILGWGNLGHDPVAQIGFKEGEGKNAKGPADPFVDEIIANQWKEAQASQPIRGENIFDTSSADLQSEGEELDQELQVATHRDDDAMSIIQMDSRLEIDTYAEQGNEELGAVNVKEATPLNYTELPENFEPTSDSTIPLWVRQNIINLGKEFGIHFNGCEEIAEELFMKIDGKRQRSGEAAKALMLMTPKSKVSKELKNLEVGTNFFSYGTRSKGG